MPDPASARTLGVFIPSLTGIETRQGCRSCDHALTDSRYWGGISGTRSSNPMYSTYERNLRSCAALGRDSGSGPIPYLVTLNHGSLPPLPSIQDNTTIAKGMHK